MKFLDVSDCGCIQPFHLLSHEKPCLLSGGKHPLFSLTSLLLPLFQFLGAFRFCRLFLLLAALFNPASHQWFQATDRDAV
ncbi:hypothetical protein [Candidatus Agathobaculum pullicola]|uniref:hypothetical protein n=1 Tax=Candidatus Agathobaculum pullicola TaxID=2838426 RepID=UPI003F8FED19